MRVVILIYNDDDDDNNVDDDDDDSGGPPDVAAQLLGVLHRLEEPAVLLNALDAKGGVHSAHLRQHMTPRCIRATELGLAHESHQNAVRSSGNGVPCPSNIQGRKAGLQKACTAGPNTGRPWPSATHRADEDVIRHGEGVVSL